MNNKKAKVRIAEFIFKHPEQVTLQESGHTDVMPLQLYIIKWLS